MTDHVELDHTSFAVADALGWARRLRSGLGALPIAGDSLASEHRNPASYPSSKGATDPEWWTDVWATPAGPQAVLGATHLGSADLDFSSRLFAGVLGARSTRQDGDSIRFVWPGGGAVVVHPGHPIGVLGIDLESAGFTCSMDLPGGVGLRARP